MASSTFNKSMKRTRNDDPDSDSDSELYITSDTWPRFMVITSASEEKPLSKLSPFAVQKGFQAIAGTLKSTKRLRDESFLVECSSCLLYTSPSPRDAAQSRMPSSA